MPMYQNGGTEVDPAFRDLEVRQDEIMRRLYELKAAVDGLAKTVTTPDADLDQTVTSLSQSPTATAFRGTSDLDSLLGKDLGALRDIGSTPIRHDRPSPCWCSTQCCASATGCSPACMSTRQCPRCARSSSPAWAAPRRQLRPPAFPAGLHPYMKDVSKLQMKFSIQNMCPIEGEANVARFLFRLVAPYPSDPALATLVDSWVDTAFFQLAEGSAKERSAVLRALNGALGRDSWLAGPELSLADIACYCCVLQTGPAASSPANVQRWLKACENLGHFGPAHPLLQ
nr:aminoacyl tRNA synthase complex-interacting multifunctional protein 2 isoform X2 [Salvelinus alpinus]